MSTILSALRSRRDARLRGDETGFSLIELMIVLLIIAILLAVAIPTYLSARNRAEDRAAQETIAHILVSAESDYASQGAFIPPATSTGMAAYLQAQNPGVTVINTGNTTPTVSAVNSVVETHGKQSLTMAAYAPDGKCFFLAEIESASSTQISSTTGIPGAGTYYGESTGQTSCTASFDAPTSGWQTSWAAASAKA